MNLLDIFEGREPHQQAIDKLEHRRIEDLEARMDDCARRGDKEGFQKCKAERDSYYKVKTDEAGIGHDIADKAEKIARATPPTKAGAVASTVKNAAKWLAGKGGPGKEGPTYEGQGGDVTWKEQERVTRLERLRDLAKRQGDKAKFAKLDAEIKDIYSKPTTEGAEDIVDRGEYDREGDMAKDNIHTIVRNAKELESVISDDENLPEWVQDKLANIKGMMTAVSEYMQTQNERDHEDVAIAEWKKEGKWKEIPKSKSGKPVDPRGEVTHLSDVARRKTERQDAQKKNSKKVDEHGGGGGGPRQWHAYVRSHRANEAVNPAQQAAIAIAKKKEQGVDEGWQDFNKVEPYAVCLAGKPVKKFDYYEEARRFHDNWKKKLYREGNTEKADKITLMPLNLDEHGGGVNSMKQYIAWRQSANKERGITKKQPVGKMSPQGRAVPKGTVHGKLDQSRGVIPTSSFHEDEMAEGIVASGPSKPLDDRAVRKLVWDTMKINADTGEQALQRALTVLAKKPQSRMVQDLQDKFQNLADRLEQGLVETNNDVRSGLAKIYNKLAPKIERYKDSFLAGQLYDELEAYAELHGAENEFKRMMNGARGRAHMEYDTNPGGFQNWFWFLPFADEQLDEFAPGAGDDREPNEEEILRQLAAQWWHGDEDPRAEKTLATMGWSIGQNESDNEGGVFVVRIGDINGDSFISFPEEELSLDEEWSKKYKDSINCSNPKGFSQRAHCAGKKKNEGMFSTLEENNEARDAVESAIIRRIMVARTDLLKKFGPQKVMDAAQAVADEHSDVEEIGTSDVSAFVHQVERYLAMNH